MFNKIKGAFMKKFNDKQLQVINDLENNLVVLASAGTGKTDTLAERVVNIINSEKAEAKEILCITFTNKACKEMQERIEQVVGDGAKDITIKTFHSWCFDIMKKEAKKQTDLFTDFIVFDEEDCEQVIEELKKLVMDFNDKSFKADKIRLFFTLIKDEMAIFETRGEVDKTVQEIITHLFENKEVQIDALCKDKSNFNVKLKKAFRDKGEKLFNAYTRILRENRGVDFADLILRTLEIFKDKVVVENLENTYRYINIDEVQDTSLVEYYIIQQIFGDNKVLLCGDIFQTIYQWRGSEPERILKHFREKYKAENIVFNKNYRATKNLVNVSVQYLHNAFPQIVQELYTEDLEIESPVEGQKVVFKETHSVDNEASYIYNEIKSKKLFDKSCVLTRDNTYNIELSKAIGRLQTVQDDFEFILVDQFKFFRRQEVKDVIAFLKLIGNPHDSISLRRILKEFKTNIGEKTLEEIDSQEYRQLGIKLTDFINSNTRRMGEPFQVLIDELEADNIIVFDVESTGVNPAEDQIIQIAAIRIDKEGRGIEWFEKFLKNDKSVASSEHVHGFSDEYLERHGEDREKVLQEFLKFSKGSIIVGHNVTFDISILRSELAKFNLGEPTFKGYYDTLDIYRRFYPNQVNHKLETLSRVFGTEHQPTHDAMDDILATAELLVMAIRDKIMPTSFERMNKVSRHLVAFGDISKQLEILFAQAEKMRPQEIVKTIVINFGMKTKYTAEKIDNLRKFYYLVDEMDNSLKDNRDSLLEVLKVTGLSNGDVELLMLKKSKKIRIPIITVHQAKGLEFNTVLLAGIQENKFPSYRSIQEKNLEEEKRTFYVAITRAKERLYISCNTKGWGERMNPKSRFIDLLPREYIEIG